MNTTNILLADDHQLVIDGLKLILDTHKNFKVVGDCANGQEVLDFLKNTYIDVVVLDINMPIMDGITCAKHIKNHFKHIKVIILTMYAQKSFLEEIIKIGIDGCLLKSNSSKELADAIDRVQSGKSYYDQIQEFNDTKDEIRKYKLGEREIEIIHLLADGLTSSQIADKLFISEHTVKTHRKNILKKLGLHSSSELIQYALNKGII